MLHLTFSLYPSNVALKNSNKKFLALSVRNWVTLLKDEELKKELDQKNDPYNNEPILQQQ